ncbi:MAG TPA: GNAT family N-acetyltransferase [Blastocatellia bacterium]|nr:GNAT family N-acetyltransferase [Blastocatellia bacterium]
MDEHSKRIEVTRTYLQLTRPDELIPARAEGALTQTLHAVSCPASFYRYLYSEVGRFYHWTDRLPWSDKEIRAHLSRPEITLWVMYCDGSPAGYFELERHSDGSTEIAYFGLIQDFLGRGLGKRLLTEAVERAWTDGANRVWLHTCTLDDPAALPNYLKRGLVRFKEEKYFTTVSFEEARLGKWRKE